MKAARFHETGAPEVLVYEDVPDPIPGPGEILLKVEAAGVNYVDIMRRRGDPMHEASPTPFTMGYEIAGVVAGHGPGADGPPVGTPVFVHAGSGAYAQYAVVQAEKAIPIPEGIDAVQMTALWLQGITAALALREAGRLGKGDTVLVEAAAGGLGILAVQLAKIWGAGTVIAAASTGEKVELARSFGADLGVNYSLPGWGEKVLRLTESRGTDLVIESVGGDDLLEALGTLAPFGRIVVLGSASNTPSLVHSGELFNHNRSLIGFGAHQYFPNTQLIKTTVAELVELVVEGRLRLQLDHVLPLSAAAQAHRLVEERRSTGKVVLLPWATTSPGGNRTGDQS